MSEEKNWRDRPTRARDPELSENKPRMAQKLSEEKNLERARARGPDWLGFFRTPYCSCVTM